MSVVIESNDKSKIQFLIDKYNEMTYCSGSQNKLSNQKIVDIFYTVTKPFYEMANQKKEKLAYEKMLCIVFVFLQVYEGHGEEFFNDHLNYQLNYYKEFGLKEQFKKIDFD